MTDTQDTEISTEERVQYVRRNALWDITSTAHDLYRKLESVRESADQAMRMMKDGQQVYGALSYGPIGIQDPADIARSAAKLQDVINLALNLGASQAAVEAAYEKGVTRS